MRYIAIAALLLLFSFNDTDAQVRKSARGNYQPDKPGKGDLELLAQKIHEAFLDYHTGNTLNKGAGPIVVEFDEENGNYVLVDKEDMKQPLNNIKSIEVVYPATSNISAMLLTSMNIPCVIKVTFKN